MHTSSYRLPVRQPYTPPSSRPRSGTPSSSYMTTAAGPSHDHPPAVGTTAREYVEGQLQEVDRIKGIADTARQNGDFEKVYRYYVKAASIIRQLLQGEYDERAISPRLRTSLIKTINGLEKWLDDYNKSPQRRHDRVHEWVATDKMEESPALDRHLRRDELIMNSRVRSENNKDRIRERDLLERDEHSVERIQAKEMMKERKESEASERAEARKKRDKERGLERRSKLEGRRDYMPGPDESFSGYAPPPISSTSSDRSTIRGDRSMARQPSLRTGKEGTDYGSHYSLRENLAPGHPIPPLTPDKTPEQATDSSTDSTPHLPAEAYMRARSLDYEPPPRRGQQAPRGASAMPSPPEEVPTRDFKDPRSGSTSSYPQSRQIPVNDPPPPRGAPTWEHEAWIQRNGRKLPPRVAELHGEYARRSSSGSHDDNPFVVRGTPPTTAQASKERYTDSPTMAESTLDAGPSVQRRPSSSQRASSLPPDLPSSGKTTPVVKTPVRGATVPSALPSQKLSPVGKAWDAVPALKSPPPAGPGQRPLGPHRRDSARDNAPTTPTSPQRRGSAAEVLNAPATVKGKGEHWATLPYAFPHQVSPYRNSKETVPTLPSNSVDRSVLKPPEQSALFNSTPGDLVKVPQVPFGAVAPQDPAYWRLPPHERPVQIQIPQPQNRNGIPTLRAVFLPPNYMTAFLAGSQKNRRAGLETVALLLGALDEQDKNRYFVTALLFPPQEPHHQYARITDDAAIDDYCRRLGAQVVGVMHWSCAGLKNSINSFTGHDLHMLYKYQKAIPETVGIAVTTRPEDAGQAVHLMRSLSQNAMQDISQCRDENPYHFHGEIHEVFESRPRGNLPHVFVNDKLLLHVEDMRE